MSSGTASTYGRISPRSTASTPCSARPMARMEWPSCIHGRCPWCVERAGRAAGSGLGYRRHRRTALRSSSIPSGARHRLPRPRVSPTIGNDSYRGHSSDRAAICGQHDAGRSRRHRGRLNGTACGIMCERRLLQPDDPHSLDGVTVCARFEQRNIVVGVPRWFGLRAISA